MAISIIARHFARASKIAYLPNEAFALTKAYAISPYDESVDIALTLNIDAKKTDQTVRGTCAMPSGLGKKIKIAVFTSAVNYKLAADAGAEFVGDSLLKDIKEGKIEFDKTIATQEMMDVLKPFGKILGPRGLMPTLKSGNVVPVDKLEETIKVMKMGSLQFRCQKEGIIHTTIGRSSFTEEELKVNLRAFIAAVNSLRPAAVRGKLLKKAFIKSTQGPAWRLDIDTIDTNSAKCLI
ncbi:unnamed protein product [Blepharisma stoltei]|uniref:Ribosomal protein n=1 Tax=Blepharisma stoltei TaxID=1481888 RepID=A0AAU9J1P9_9CILI|nr:unnamed protein product [Blepharisma stoltei]